MHMPIESMYSAEGIFNNNWKMLSYYYYYLFFVLSVLQWGYTKTSIISSIAVAWLLFICSEWLSGLGRTINKLNSSKMELSRLKANPSRVWFCQVFLSWPRHIVKGTPYSSIIWKLFRQVFSNFLDSIVYECVMLWQCDNVTLLS